MSNNSLISSLSQFCKKNKSCESIFAPYLQLEELDSSQRCTILNLLSDLLKDSRFTKSVAEYFRNILLILLTSAISLEQNFCDSQHFKTQHRQNCSILGKLIGSHPDVLSFSLRYFEKYPAPFSFEIKKGTPEITSVEKSQDEATIITDYDIVLASYNILNAKPNHFKRKWNWSEIYLFLTHSEDKIKWIAWNCIGIVLDMSESLRLKCISAVMDSTVVDKFILESKEENVDDITTFGNIHQEKELMLEKIQSLISISDVLLPILNDDSEELKCSLVLVPSMKDNLRSLALAVAMGKCVCVQGTVGCGKTSMIEYISKVTGRSQSDFMKVQLGDQTDSKIMLGTYRCTEIPGEFIWQPGILTRAVIDGKWLLLEDIDSATLDVLSTLSNLLETGTLSVPGHRDLIQAKSGFQLFVTQRLFSSTTGIRKQVSNASNMLEKYWTCVNMESFSKQELITIIETLFPKLRTIAPKMVDVFLIFKPNEESDFELKNLISRSGRLISTRDLIKWCTRAVVYYLYPTSDAKKQNLFEDAIDIFCCSTVDEKKRQCLVIAIGHKLGINKVSAENIFQTYKPTITCENDFVAGRAKLPCKTGSYVNCVQRKVTFSFTRPSSCLLERIACCVNQREPVLLVGETGTGKTSAIQYLAESTGNTLIVINMNQLSESADFLGGYKPVDLKFLIKPIREEFEFLFRSYFAVEPNKKYLEAISFCYCHEKWDTLLKSMLVSTKSALNRLKTSSEAIKWENLALKIEKLSLQVKAGISLGFAFVEGSLVKAIQKGYWVLLDEINLANAETLEYLSGLLEGSSGSLSLLERGDECLLKRHPDFTLFACMNPATDVGKKELPTGLRNRFTEFFVDELTSKIDLQILVDSYLKNLNVQCKHETIVKFYLNLRKEAHLILLDGTMNKPHYSLRTLCRALSITAANPCQYELRSLYEAFCLSFLTQLDHKSYPIVENLIIKTMLDEKTAKRILSTPIPRPKCNLHYINFEGYWITRGTVAPETPTNYILTPSVKRNLKDVARAVSIGKMPILLQGDTSVGKTSLITYLAKASGHVCVRINNHEHTDLQEYVGSYVADENGKLVFREGILVEAMRKGYWIILDELNLAPSDVLEALNRVLDDNRELFISETQQVVKANNEFMLFATQNPPGLYGGRKILSRAFKNRFVEFHFDEIPPIELQEILQKRCSMPESYCKQIINVMKDLQVRRKNTAAFAGKKGFITLRDLFRWGERYRLSLDVGQGFYDWSQHLADEGYLVLAAKVRLPEEEDEIRQVIKKHLKRDVKPQDLFTLSKTTSLVTKHVLEEIFKGNISNFKHIVWTYHLRKMAVLLMKSSQFQEPVLLVGETGCGKTTVCQLIASMQKQKLHIVNCHMHTESSDFLGNLRPVRNQNDEENQKLFEWVDGPLIHAMRNGDLFLADEISLADDSVLERLNSLLEPERTLVLAEKGINLTNLHETDSIIVANKKFLFVGTMNPGGDYGKKELSPALRNRFTEIWCDPCTEGEDIKMIIEHNLDQNLLGKELKIASCILNFLDWIKSSDFLKNVTISTRDLLSWIDFINISTSGKQLLLEDAILQGACLTFIDGIGSNTIIGSSKQLDEFKYNALQFLTQQIKCLLGTLPCIKKLTDVTNLKVYTQEFFGIEPFFIEKGQDYFENSEKFTFISPTTKLNTLKLLRAMQIKKPILLEGSPGVGKTSLVSAVAKESGHTFFRINLSDQTDVCDLFGTDLPVEGGKGGEFSWRDGPFLRALRAGHWILLDELNLASQAVLESLNACFDHRGELFIPELGKTFFVTPGTKFFACQNPMKQGGARRGLPKSFLNRFTQVFINTLKEEDLKFIISSQFPELTEELVHRMVDFNTRISAEAGVLWGLNGSPWEMNLRDVIRWCEATISSAKSQCDDSNLSYNPGCCVELIYADRMRSKRDKDMVSKIYMEIFSNIEYPLPPTQPILYMTDDKLYFGDIVLNRTQSSLYEGDLLLLREQMKTLRSLAQCINLKWMSILVGGPASGKSSIVRVISQLAGQKLKTVVVNSAMDTNEILGGFEQTDYNRHLEQLFERTESLVIDCLKSTLFKTNIESIRKYHKSLEKVRNIIFDEYKSMTSSMEIKNCLHKIEELACLVFTTKGLGIRTDELDEILEKLDNLSKIIKKESCLNAGGKFEWVDSLLVKCLQDGSWLLLDQVNFCSPALLDRLNGLLEPNGELTIGERGTDIDGNIMTIKPHKNFRLFLTMDPKYGEISRAMRNRGVEIFLIGRDKIAPKEDLDLRSLLCNCGLVSKIYQDILFEIHEKISQDVSTTETFNTTYLIQSAFLIKQQISRGFPLTSAFKKSCEDVYIKARAISVHQAKDRLESLIQETLNHFNNTIYLEEQSINLSTITWQIKESLENSKLSRIKQHGVLLNHFFNHIQTLDDQTFSLEYLALLLNLEHLEDLKQTVASDIIPYLLLEFFEKSSRNDVELRTQWLVKQYNKSDREILRCICEKLKKEILSFKFHFSNNELPWDIIQLPRAATKEIKEKAIHDSNRLALLLYWTKIEDDLCRTHSSNKRTVKRYSTELMNGTLNCLFKDEPLINSFTPFTNQIQKFMDIMLREQSLILNASDYVKLRHNLQLYRRYIDLGNIDFIINKKVVNEFINLSEISLVLKVHYKWIVKFIKTLMTSLSGVALSESCKIEFQKLIEIIDHIDQQLFGLYNPLVKVAKRIKSLSYLPFPNLSKFIADSFSKLMHVTHYFETWKNHNGSKDSEEIDSNIIILLSEEGLNFRQQLLSFWRKFFETNSFEEDSENCLLKIQEFCVRNHLEINHCSKTAESIQKCLLNQTELATLSVNTQLWPVYEYMFLLWSNRIQQVTCATAYDNYQSFDITTQFWQKWTNMPSIPANILGIMSAILHFNKDPEKTCRLVPVLSYLLKGFTPSSYSINDLKILSYSNKRSIKQTETTTSAINPQVERISHDAPDLLNLVLQLLINKSQTKIETFALVMPSLGAHEARISQLKRLKILLWRNSISFNSDKFDCLLNDQKLFYSCANHFMTLSDRLQLEKQLGSIESERNAFSEFKRIFKELQIAPKTECNVFKQGKAWALFGYIQTALFTSLGYVDPVYKIEQKLRNAEEDIKDLKGTIFAKVLQSRVLGDAESLTNLHPRFVEIETSINNIVDETNILQSKRAYRPADLEFLGLVKEFENFRNTLGNYQVVQNHILELSKVFANFNDNKRLDIQAAERVVLKTETWQESLQQFINRMESRFLPFYPDLILPAFAAISDMKHGIHMMSKYIQRLINITSTSHQGTSVEDLIEKLVSPNQINLLDLIDVCTHDSTREIINKNLKIDNNFDSFKEQFKITLSGLHELHNHILLNGNMSQSLWHKLSDIMHQVILIWKQQQKEILKRDIEEESMYKNKAQLHGGETIEEEEIKLELENLFPTYREEDFNDIEIETEHHGGIEDSRSVSREQEFSFLSVNDIEKVSQLYCNILTSCISCDWLKLSSQCKNLDYINPLLIRWNTVKLLLNNLRLSVSPKLSQHLYLSLNYLTDVTLSISQGGKVFNEEKPFDFYKDSNISETTSCLSILSNILIKNNLLLNEWPEHPTLRAIHVVLKRILDFPVTSSISRFLTGLELLLLKMKEWEENAHKGVSLFDEMSILTQQIISWRRLELSSWKDCLKVTFQRLRSQSAKWCFWLYILLESYINKSSIKNEDNCFVNDSDVLSDEAPTQQNLAESLHFFISKSPLSEFEARLELLLALHCHAFFLNSSQERDEVLSITWNVYNYYKQFTDEVNDKINSIKKPIEKKLKDFVKITRWNDISYWAVKETIAKSHKTLHKFIKEYEKGLKDNVASCLLVKPSNSNIIIHKDISNKDSYLINPDVFILPLESIKKFDLKYIKERLGLKLVNLHKITNNLKNEIITSDYSQLRVRLERLIKEYMERSSDLKKIEIDSTLPKPKQVSHAKSVLQQKKKTLADYFKIIAHLGVSYRIGILAWKNKQDTVIDLMISPLNLTTALRNLDSEADKWMLTQWNGCENYYQKAVAEFIALNQILSNPHKDLGSLNTERFKGYSAHLLLMANEQKRILSEKIKYFVAFRSQMLSLKQIKDGENCDLPEQQGLLENAKRFKLLLVILQSSLQQLQLYLNACPCKSDMEDNEIYDLEENVLPILYVTKEDLVWEKVNSVIKDYLHSLGTISHQFDLKFHSIHTLFEKEVNVQECVPVLTMDQFNFLNESYMCLENLKIKLTEIEEVFGSKQNLNHPLIKNIEHITERISEGIKEFDKLKTKTGFQHDKQTFNNSDSEFNKTLIDVLCTALKTLQVNKKVVSEVTVSSCELSEQLKKNALSEILIKSLTSEIEGMHLEYVYKLFNKLLFMIHGLDCESAHLHFKIVKKCLPLFEQYLLYIHFYLNEQVASFRLICKMLHLQLTVFLDLASNGFCMPKNLDLDIDADGEEGSQETTGKGGMGLSNEEGVQDVSERIESEDQLDEAKSKESEENDNDNKSCTEEENGIDMSTDFDGTLQDIEKREGDSENSDDDNEDLDKEMGETNEESNQQEKEIWGKDEDEESEDENQENNKEDEKTGKGEELDDKTMGAKNNEEALTEESKESREKEEISEINEPDINDDQIDPYNGNQQPEVEPQVLDLPENINLDDEDQEGDQDKQDEDMFDIDKMKEPVLPPEDETEKDDTDDIQEDPENNGDENDSNADSEVDSPLEKNIEVAPIKNDMETLEDSETVPEENDNSDEQTVPDTNYTDRLVDNAMQVDVETEEIQNDVNYEVGNKEKMSQNENIQDSQNDFGTGRSNKGFGKTETSLNEGGAQTDKKSNEEIENKKRKSPKEMENRSTTLMDQEEPLMKKAKTNIQERQENLENLDDNDKQLDNETDNTETEYRHVDSKERYTRCAMDAATKDQVKEQGTKITMDIENKEDEEPMDVNMLHEDEINEEESHSKDQLQESKQVLSSEDKNNGKTSKAKNEVEEMEIDSDLSIVETTKVERGTESAFYTNLVNLSCENIINSIAFEKTRDQVKQVLAHWEVEPSTEEAITAWNSVSLITDASARELAEKLRLVLEPTQASRLKGDYKTGKRLNMRKIIPYIASQFRKDKIWLRRTKPSKRNYQIVLAIDDSSSMVDNDSKEIAFESLSLISKAMTYLEAGQLGVISFGEDVKELHPLGEVFTQESGARLMQKMRFEQSKTRVPQLVNYSIDMFNMQNDLMENAKLLVILSDGRGIFSEGINKMNYAVRRARLAGVFIVFIVTDNQKNKESILDIRMPISKPGQPLVIHSYMEHFPFPFYMILRDINALPEILSDALRQWFELIGNMDS